MLRNEKDDPKTPIDALLDSFTTQTERMHKLAGFPLMLLLLGVFLALLDFIPGYEAKTEILYLAIAALIGSVLTYLAELYYNLRMSNARADLLRGYLSMLVDRFLPREAKLQDVQAAIDSIIRPMLGLESKKDQD